MQQDGLSRTNTMEEGAAQLIAGDGVAPYVLQFSSLGAKNAFSSGASVPPAVIFIADASTRITLDPEIMTKLYGLTKAEIKAVAALGGGADVSKLSPLA